MLCCIVGIRHGTRAGPILGGPLLGTGGALGQFPFIVEEVLEEIVAPLRRRRGPDDFQAASDRIVGVATAKAVHPAEPLLVDRSPFWFWPNILVGIAGTMGFAEGVATGDQGNGLFVVHRHARKGLANVSGRRDWVGATIWPFRIHINQPHLYCRKGIFECTIATVAFVAQPGVLWAPVNVFFGLPDIFATAAEAECLKAH